MNESRLLLYLRCFPPMKSRAEIRFGPVVIQTCPSCKGGAPNGCNYCNSGGL